MKKIFIAYANEALTYSLKRIGCQARELGIFDEVILWTPQDLPDDVLHCELMQHSYGGGYWAWKPIIIRETLRKYGDDAVVCYVDAGCTLKKGVEWVLYFELMSDCDFLCFKYRDTMPCWEKYGSASTKIKHWTKRQAAEFYDELVGNAEWRENNKIWGGVIFAKGKHNPIVEEWCNIVLRHPEIIMHTGYEKNQYPYFAQHKHDQPLLVALTTKYTSRCVVLPELSETCGENVAIYASRVRARRRVDYIVWQLKKSVHAFIGDGLYKRLKHLLIRE